MSEFNQAIETARRRQRHRMLWLSVGATTMLLLIIIIMLMSQASRIRILPDDGAKQSNIRIEAGFATVIANRLYSLSRQITMSVSAPEFESSVKQLTHNDFGKVITVTLKPLPAHLMLQTVAANNTTQWFINNKLIAVAEQLDTTLEAGEYSVHVNHPYFEPLTHNWRLGRGQTINEQLELLPINGFFQVNTHPTGALVSIGAEHVGTTPLSIALDGGKYSVRIDHPDYESIDDEIVITHLNKQVSRNYQLNPKSAEVNFSLYPAGGTLTVNGTVITATETVTIPANQNTTLTYSKPGFFSQSHRLNLTAAESRSIDFSLEKELGKVDIHSQPVANISINGQPTGQTPRHINLNAVPQEITLTLPGYRSVSRILTPSAKSTSLISVTLLPEKQAHLQDAPPTYTTSAGDQMVLFKPDESMMMGAERSEPGQRANEFIRTVTLNRPFYAGLHEVTHAAYAQFKQGHSGSPQRPVTAISWTDAAQYANWLSQQEGLSPVYVFHQGGLTKIHPLSNGYRLLTEAEWEWLARKANRSSQTLFSWGNAKTLPPKAANIADESAKGSVNIFVPRYDDGYPTIAPVMSMQRELSGLFDMGGNVKEWTHDSYSLNVPEKGANYSHTLDTSIASQRVIKGASWRSGSLSELRAAWREGLSAPRDDVGFRLARFVYGGE